MEKQRIAIGVETPIVFRDTPMTRRLSASMKDGRIVLMDRYSCAVFYRTHSEIVRLRDVDIRKDKSGYYIIL